VGSRGRMGAVRVADVGKGVSRALEWRLSRAVRAALAIVTGFGPRYSATETVDMENDPMHGAARGGRPARSFSAGASDDGPFHAVRLGRRPDVPDVRGRGVEGEVWGVREVEGEGEGGIASIRVCSVAQDGEDEWVSEEEDTVGDPRRSQGTPVSVHAAPRAAGAAGGAARGAAGGGGVAALPVGGTVWENGAVELVDEDEEEGDEMETTDEVTVTYVSAPLELRDLALLALWEYLCDQSETTERDWFKDESSFHALTTTGLVVHFVPAHVGALLSSIGVAMVQEGESVRIGPVPRLSTAACAEADARILPPMVHNRLQQAARVLDKLSARTVACFIRNDPATVREVAFLRLVVEAILDTRRPALPRRRSRRGPQFDGYTGCKRPRCDSDD
jgi:hypothetical protein